MATFKKDNKKLGKKDTWTTKFYYKDWDGTRKQKKKEGFATKKEAQAFEKDYLDLAVAGNNMMFSNLVKHYYDYIENRLKPTTIENKKHLIDKKILPFFKNMRLNEIEPSTIMKWQNELIAQGYLPTYLKSIHNQLSAIFNFSMKFYKHNSNPARICGSMGKKDADSMDFYTLDEFNEFISYFEDDPTTTLMFEILFWTGCRLGELLALTPSDFDFNKHTMVIDENYQRIKGKNIVQCPKTYSSNRSITLPKNLSTKIQAYLKRLKDIESHDFIFDISKSTLGRRLKRGAAASNLRPIRVHDLRHSHASHLIELGFSALVIKDRLGHKDIKTTLQTYAHLYPNKDVEVAETLDTLYLNKQE